MRILGIIFGCFLFIFAGVSVIKGFPPVETIALVLTGVIFIGMGFIFGKLLERRQQ